MMGEHLGFSGLDIREPFLNYPGDFAMQFLSAALEQRVVSRVLHQPCLNV
jgi:hypothetical protein